MRAMSDPASPSRKTASDHGTGEMTRKAIAQHKIQISEARLHLVHGGIENGDKRLLERTARGSRLTGSWIVPKGAAIGDEVVIKVGDGLFATGRIRSRTKARPDWPRRYGARLEAIKLIKPPISIATLRLRVPDLKWTQYPRSITTPSKQLADQIRELIRKRTQTGMLDTNDAALESSSIEELREIATLRPSKATTAEERKRIIRIRSKGIRRYVLARANGSCEGCFSPAPFLGVDGRPFLEVHHPKRLGDGGIDHISNTIALCPNCHARTECSGDAESFNASLIRRLAAIENQFPNAIAVHTDRPQRRYSGLLTSLKGRRGTGKI